MRPAAGLSLVAATMLLALAVRPTPRPAPRPARASAPLDGRWLVTVTEPDSTQIVVRLTIEQRDTVWEGYSRANAVREIIGRGTALLGGALGKLPQHGALLRIEAGTASQRAGDTIVVGGTLASEFFGRYVLSGTVVRGRLRAVIRRATAPAGPAGSIEGVLGADETPVRDYRALAASVLRAGAEYVYDPALTTRSEWRSFATDLATRFAEARDDLDAIGAFYALAPKLGSSHWQLMRNPKIASTPIEAFVAGDPSVRPDTFVVLNFPAPGVAHLWVKRWDRVTPAIDRAFARIDSAKIGTLILDIRSNPGGDATSMSPAAHLLRDSVAVGVILGSKWYARHRAPPTRSELASLPTVTPTANGADFIMRQRETGAVVGVIAPRMPRFDGAVYLLIDNATGSASEPLAYLLKSTKRATLVGERTAGKVLTALPHSLGDGWVLIVPEADYYMADGVRLEGNGVEPDITTKRGDAFIETAERLALSTPYANAQMRAWAHMASSRFDDAERLYREAMRLAPDSVAPLIGLGNVYRIQRKWDAAFDMWEQRLAAHPGDLASLGQIGTIAALSGQRLPRGEEALREYLRHTPPASIGGQIAANKRLAAILIAAGNPDGARAAYEAVVRLDPADAEAQRALRTPRP